MHQSGARVNCTPMTTERASGAGHPVLRRNAVWPWLVMPLIILALFALLHDVRRSGGGNEQDSTSEAGIP
jgi:hypothetical protein